MSWFRVNGVCCQIAPVFGTHALVRDSAGARRHRSRGVPLRPLHPGSVRVAVIDPREASSDGLEHRGGASPHWTSMSATWSPTVHARGRFPPTSLRADASCPGVPATTARPVLPRLRSVGRSVVSSCLTFRRICLRTRTLHVPRVSNLVLSAPASIRAAGPARGSAGRPRPDADPPPGRARASERRRVTTSTAGRLDSPTEGPLPPATPVGGRVVPAPATSQLPIYYPGNAGAG